MSPADPLNRLLDAFEESVRAHLDHPEIGAAAAQRLRRLLPAEPVPAPEVPPTPARLALTLALTALRTVRPRSRDKAQVAAAVGAILAEIAALSPPGVHRSHEPHPQTPDPHHTACAEVVGKAAA